MNLSFKNFPILILLSCYFSPGSGAEMQISEAQQIALESSGELLPPETLSQRVEKDLQAIRTKYSEVATTHHTPKWQPGKLIISNANKKTIDTIQNSVYGPVEAKPIFQDTIYTLTFTKPYNPEKLAENLEKELGVNGASPDGIIGGSSSITLTCDATGKNTYVFFIGSGDCPSGCINRRYITYTVDPEGNVERVKDTNNSGDNQPY